MATTNGDVQIETAQSFARDYLDDLFNNNKNLGAFEEETLDLNIKSKYDDIEIEDEDEEKKAESSSSSSSSSSDSEEEDDSSKNIPEPTEKADEPLEPGHDTFEVHQVTNGHTNYEAEQNGDVLEPGHSQFTTTNSNSEVLEPGVSEFRGYETPAVAQAQQVVEEEEEAEDVVAPIPSSRKTAEEEEEDEFDEEKFAKKLNINKNWWANGNQKDESEPTPDKFRTIKQNIRKGNTRSLLARFENLSKVSE